MSKEIEAISPYWRTVRVSGIRKWVYLDRVHRIVGKEWFNMPTMGISVYIGYETEEHSTTPISNELYYISVDCHVANYFGDKSGMHFRSKDYVLIDGILYKQDGDGLEVKRITKELKGVLAEINTLKGE